MSNSKPTVKTVSQLKYTPRLVWADSHYKRGRTCREQRGREKTWKVRLVSGGQGDIWPAAIGNARKSCTTRAGSCQSTIFAVADAPQCKTKDTIYQQCYLKAVPIWLHDRPKESTAYYISRKTTILLFALFVLLFVLEPAKMYI